MAIVASFAALNLALIAATRPYVFPLDDAYITLHNAQALWSGDDPNYRVPALVGATSPVHLLLVAIFLPFFGGFAPAIVGFLGGAAYLLGVSRIGASFALARAAQMLLLVVAVGTGSVFFQLTNGLETAWALAAVTWAIVLASGGGPTRLLAGLCGLLPFVRPELALLAGPLLLRQFHLRTKAANPAANIAADIALACCASLPWVVWMWMQTGTVLPNTAEAKVAFFAEQGTEIPEKLAIAALGIAMGLGPVAIAPLLAKRSSLGAALLAFFGLFLLAFALKFPGGLFQNWHRYVFTMLPVCLWALCSFRDTRPVLLKFLLPGLALIASLSIARSIQHEIEGQDMVRDAFEAAAWANANIPPDRGLLVHDAGVIAYVAKNPLVDLVGLKTPESIAAHRKWTLPSGGSERAKAIGEIAQNSGFRYAIIHRDSFWFKLADDLRAEGWDLIPVREPSTTAGGYVIFRLTRPNPNPAG